MRRGRGRGNNNSMGRNSDAPGPLMTEHIRNLDLELELLKRKREMIEQQQHLLGRQINYGNQRQFNPPMYGSNSRAEPLLSRNFSLMYDDHPTPDYIPLNSGARKRPSEPTWRETLQPKRFSGPSPRRGNAKKSFGSRPGPDASPASASSTPSRYFNSKPMSAKAKPPANQKPRITPTHSFKPKSNAPPNKLATYPAAERKALVANAVKATKEAMVLLPDRTPSLQLNGRLELALGYLLKEIKTKYRSINPYSICFLSQTTMKPMKMLIRERIREVMMGKKVGALPDIMEQYRQKYPHESDVDIVNEGLAHQTPGDVKHITKGLTTENPKEYFKENISLMIDQKLHQMFLKLSQIYSNDAQPGETIVELTPIQGPDNKFEEADFSKDVTVEPEENLTKEVTQEKEDIVKEKEETEPKEKEETDPKEKEETVQMETEENVPTDTEGENVTIQTEDNTTKDEGETPVTKSVILDGLIEQKLPEILKKHIKFIKSLLNFDEMYDAMVIRKSYKMDFDEAPPAKANVNPAKYYVKIYGRKGFPRKNAMQEFLKEFKPKSVKKHKAMNNLLFVGFDDKESFDKILAANGTVMGRSTLQITVSENKKDKPEGKDADEKTNDDDDVAIVEDENADSTDISKDEKILSAELDTQITDLLTSIKQAEESPNTSLTIEDDDNMQVDVDKTYIDENVVEGTVENAGGNAELEDTTSENAVMTEAKNIDSKTDKTDEDVEQNAEKPNIIKPEPKTPTKKDLEVIKEGEENTVPIESDGTKNTVESVRNEASGKATPIRASARVAANATPSTIRTRRASRLAQNNQ